MRPTEPTVLGQLYRRHAPALRLYARQWGGSAEDLVQNAFVRLARQVPPPDNVVAWLYGVVRNEARAEQRGAARRRRREQRAGAPEEWLSPAEDRIDAGEAARRLAELPLELREVIVARLWGGLTFEEVAALVGCSLATAHRRYHAGLEQLRERLEGRWTRNPAPTT
ncbi:MAG TPA: sigma-70 family RNA polymerase sigma factor [Gemmataceae bacterium]|nr:sigma-70 family RNA polymerase sigma factor [Gemmataceae bacterium]